MEKLAQVGVGPRRSRPLQLAIDTTLVSLGSCQWSPLVSVLTWKALLSPKPVVKQCSQSSRVIMAVPGWLFSQLRLEAVGRRIVPSPKRSRVPPRLHVVNWLAQSQFLFDFGLFVLGVQGWGLVVVSHSDTSSKKKDFLQN